MLFSEIFRLLGRYLLSFALILCVPLGVSLWYEFSLEPGSYECTIAFMATLLITLLLSGLLLRLGRRALGIFYKRESLIVVILIWVITVVISAVPFLMTRTLTNPLDACFESMSALTTTGGSVIAPKAYDNAGAEIPITIPCTFDPCRSFTYYGTVTPIRDPVTHEIVREGIEAVSKGILFWRSFLEWLGGMGIVVLFIAVFPALAIGGRYLFEAEVTGPSKEGVTPRIKETASLLWKIYVGFTVIELALLMITNRSLSFFDALNLTFSTISTGGFSIHNDSLAAYHNGATNAIVMIFMIVGSINFILYYHCLKGKIYRIYEPEFFYFLLSLFLSCLLLSWNLWDTPKEGGVFSWSEALYYGSFHAISSQTSTGLSLANYTLWPASCQSILLILMFVGGMSGSTSGGIKIIRHCIFFRVLFDKVESLFRPETVRSLKIGRKEISSKTALTVLVFVGFLIIITIGATFLFITCGLDPFTAFSTTACMINNGGMTFGAASSSFAFLTPLAKGLSIFLMLLGRLELFAILALFFPAFWRK